MTIVNPHTLAARIIEIQDGLDAQGIVPSGIRLSPEEYEVYLRSRDLFPSRCGCVEQAGMHFQTYTGIVIETSDDGKTYGLGNRCENQGYEYRVYPPLPTTVSTE